MIYALVLNNEVKELRDYPATPDCKHIDGVPVLRPFVEHDETIEMKHDGYIISASQVERKLSARSLDEAKAYVTSKIPAAKAKNHKVPREQALENLIKNANNVNALNAIDLNSGW